MPLVVVFLPHKHSIRRHAAQVHLFNGPFLRSLVNQATSSSSSVVSSAATQYRQHIRPTALRFQRAALWSPEWHSLFLAVRGGRRALPTNRRSIGY